MPAAPTVIAGRYRLGRSLGAGGMGRVWLARDETLDRDVAVKELLLPAELSGDDAQQRMLREARAAARLSHPNVVQVYDMFEADGRTWIVMEYVDRGRCRRFSRPTGRWNRAGSRRSAWPCWPRWTPRTTPVSGTATSSPRTCSWPATAGSC